MNIAPLTHNENGEPTTIVERIYTTKGDNLCDDGIKNDKAIAIVIKGGIFWLERSFARLSELEYLLHSFNISILEDGQWGVKDEDGSVTFTNKITKISKHHDDIWSEDSSYIKKAVRTAGGGVFWTVLEVFDHFYNDASLEVDNKPFLQGEILKWSNEFNTVECNFRGLLECATKAVVMVNGMQMPVPVSELSRA